MLTSEENKALDYAKAQGFQVSTLSKFPVEWWYEKALYFLRDRLDGKRIVYCRTCGAPQEDVGQTKCQVCES